MGHKTVGLKATISLTSIIFELAARQVSSGGFIGSPKGKVSIWRLEGLTGSLCYGIRVVSEDIWVKKIAGSPCSKGEGRLAVDAD